MCIVTEQQILILFTSFQLECQVLLYKISRNNKMTSTECPAMTERREAAPALETAALHTEAPPACWEGDHVRPLLFLIIVIRRPGQTSGSSHHSCSNI